MLRRSHVASTIATEEAAIDRWFGRGPFGLVFYGEDGRAWRINEDIAERWKSRASSQVHAFIARSSKVEFASIAAIMAIALVGGIIGGAVTDSGPGGAGTALVFALAAHPFFLFARLALFRRDQRDLKRELIASLGLVSPLPAEAVAHHRDHNIWYPLMYGVIFLMVAAVVIIELWMHHGASAVFSSNDKIDQIGTNMGWIMLLMVPGLGLSWLFYFLAKAKDRKLRR